jgi:hypothetical protein
MSKENMANKKWHKNFAIQLAANKRWFEEND